MIRTIAELFQQLKAKELEALAAFPDVQHPGMLGDMYEGLTRSMVTTALFEGLDLRIVTGKIRAPDGTLSRQLDVMVVVGSGQRVPHTEHFLYPTSQVLAVIEVKKTLYSTAMSEAYDNLLSLSARVFLETIPVEPLRKVYRRLTHREFPVDGDLSALPWDQEMFAHVAVLEVALPARIVLGYGGYANEKTLRDGFVEYLQGIAAGSPTEGYGFAQLPSLIACGDSVLVKLNAMPYSAASQDQGWSLVYGSIPGVTSLVVLEVLWTRLASRFEFTPAIFGEDLDVEALRPLLYAKPARADGRYGWAYKYVSRSLSELQSTPKSWGWTPERLTTPEATIMGMLCDKLAIRVDSASWKAFLHDEGEALPAFIEKMKVAGIAALVDEEFKLLTDGCAVVCMPSGEWVVGENSTGRLTRWVANQQRIARTATRPRSDSEPR